MIEVVFPVLKDAVHHAWSKTILPDPAADRPRDPAITPGIRISKSQVASKSPNAPMEIAKPSAPMSALAQAKFQAEDERLSQDLAVSLAALGLTTAGALVAHPLALLSLPLLIKLSIPYWREGYHSLVEKRKIDGAVRDAVVSTGFLAAGMFSFNALWFAALSLSRKLVLRTRTKSEQALTSAFGEQPRTVWVVAPNGQEIEIPFEELKQGDQVIVRAGEHIPADGYITQGIAAIDRRMLTGESQPVENGVGDPVFASTLVVSGQIVLRVEKSGRGNDGGSNRRDIAEHRRLPIVGRVMEPPVCRSSRRCRCWR